MNIKAVAISLYMMLIYWLSIEVASLHMMFFPTLGAFSFLFLTRPMNLVDFSRIASGAILCSILGTLLFFISSSALSLLCTSLVTIWLLKRFQWNAPPILAVSLIPFFAQPIHLWTIPLSVLAAMAGLLLTLVIAYTVDARVKRWSTAFMKRPVMVESESD